MQLNYGRQRYQLFLDSFDVTPTIITEYNLNGGYNFKSPDTRFSSVGNTGFLTLATPELKQILRQATLNCLAL